MCTLYSLYSVHCTHTWAIPVTLPFTFYLSAEGRLCLLFSLLLHSLFVIITEQKIWQKIVLYFGIHVVSRAIHKLWCAFSRYTAVPHFISSHSNDLISCRAHIIHSHFSILTFRCYPIIWNWKFMNVLQFSKIHMPMPIARSIKLKSSKKCVDNIQRTTIE